MNEEERRKYIEEMYEDFADVIVPTAQELDELLERVRREDELDPIDNGDENAAGNS